MDLKDDSDIEIESIEVAVYTSRMVIMDGADGRGKVSGESLEARGW
jgi:hypothetical protein